MNISRPDLRDQVGLLVQRVCETEPTQRLSVEELIRILGVRVAPVFHGQLAARGDLLLHADRFENVGPAITRKVRLLGFDVQLDIGDHLGGHISRGPAGFTLRFHRGASVTAHKLFFRVELRQVDIQTDHIKICFEGAQDLHIALS